MKKLEDYIRTIPDFPEPGIMFRDITTVFQDADGLQLAIDSMQDLIKDLDFDVIVGAESRGFIYGAALAYNLHKPLVLIRKKGNSAAHDGKKIRSEVFLAPFFSGLRKNLLTGRG